MVLLSSRSRKRNSMLTRLCLPYPNDTGKPAIFLREEHGPILEVRHDELGTPCWPAHTRLCGLFLKDREQQTILISARWHVVPGRLDNEFIGLKFLFGCAICSR